MSAQSEQQGVKRLLELWRLRCLRASFAHYRTSTQQRGYDTILTTLNVATAILVASAASAYWVISAKSEVLNIFIASVAVINVITSVIQYIFDFRARALAHKRAASDFSILNRRIELALVTNISGEEMDSIRTELDGLGDASPPISKSIWESAKEWTVRIDKAEKEIFPDGAVSIKA